mmetsp:Transcript_9361/g.34691  ORF Transcript_9361/g.34691 Transcript_9361/m.34691 type:complete len:457 (-) Transcript_9361:2097-3467(-)
MSRPNPLSTFLTLPASHQTLQNRIIKAPLTECLASAVTNAPNEKHVRLYSEWAKQAKPAALITGNIMVDRRYLEAPNNVVVNDERDLDMLKKWSSSVQKYGVKLIGQISHPGRQSPISITWEPLAPSKTAGAVKMLLPAFRPPRELAHEEIQDICQMYINAAEVLWKGGFDGVQVHSAHGYLINQFLSPKWNERTDEYGGNQENRRRFLREIVVGIRERIKDPSFVVCVKLNSADFQRGGFSEEESMEVVLMLCDLGVDFIEISGGNYENAVMMQSVNKYQQKKKSTREREAFFMDYVKKVRQLFEKEGKSVPLMLSGGFRSQGAMEDALTSGAVDIVGLGRPFCLEPKKIAQLTTKKSLPSEEISLVTPRINFEWDIMRTLDPGIDNLWHQRQMWLLAEGKEPDFTITRIWLLTGHTFYNYIWHPKRTTAMGWVRIAACMLVTVAAAGWWLSTRS